MADIEVRRTSETSNSVAGELWLNGSLFCYTLEPSRDNPVHTGHPCIPAGAYSAIISHSPHLNYDTPELQNVPGRSDIRIHIGNYPKDSLGCILVGGAGNVPDFIGQSRLTFESLMAEIRGEPITVTVNEAISQ